MSLREDEINEWTEFKRQYSQSLDVIRIRRSRYYYAMTDGYDYRSSTLW